MNQNEIGGIYSLLSKQFIAKSNKTLVIKNQHFPIYKIPDDTGVIQSDLYAFEGIQEKFDLILFENPLGMPAEEFDCSGKMIRVRKNWKMIYNAAKLLKDDGVAICILEPLGFNGESGKKFTNYMSENGVFVNALIETDVKLYNTSLLFLLAIISKRKTEKLATITIESISDGLNIADDVENYIKNQDASKFTEVNIADFNGFAQMKAEKSLKNFQTQFQNCKFIQLQNLNVQISSADKYQENPSDSVVFLRKRMPCKTNRNFDEISSNSKNWFAIAFDDSDLCEYFDIVAQSDYGTFLFESVASGTVLPTINHQELAAIEIPIPDKQNLAKAVTISRRVGDIETILRGIRSKLSMNHLGTDEIFNQVVSIASAVGDLSDSERIRSLVITGEDKCTEFKETYSLNVRTQQKDEKIEESALKTIVAFLNTDGGILLIGVNDAGEILGLAEEIQKISHGSKDKYLLSWKNLIKDKIGEEFYPHIDSKIVAVGSNDVLMVKCEKSLSPCFLKPSKFYVRTNPSTDLLDGKKMLDYCNARFATK